MCILLIFNLCMVFVGDTVACVTGVYKKNFDISSETSMFSLYFK